MQKHNFIISFQMIQWPSKHFKVSKTGSMSFRSVEVTIVQTLMGTDIFTNVRIQLSCDAVISLF